MKVAVLMYGQPRFAGRSEAFNSHKKFILDQYDCDIFSHLWFSSDLSEFETSSWSQNTVCPVESNAIDKIRDLYNPRILIADQPRIFKFEQSIRESISQRYKTNIWTDKNLSNVLSHLNSIEQASRLLRGYSTVTNIRYDFIILLRTDLVILDMPDLNTLDHNKFYLSNHHDAFPDLCFIYGSKFQKWSDNLYSSHELVYSSRKILEPSAEAFKSGLFDLMCHSIDKSPIHMPCHLITNRNGKIYVG